VSSTDIYGNDGGDAVCGTDAGANFSVDPRLCDPPGGDFHLQPTSMCARRQVAGLVGALDIGCGLEEYQTDEVMPPGMKPVAEPARAFLRDAGNCEAGPAVGPGAVLEYHVPMPGRVLITVHDVRGRSVRVLVDAVERPGTHTVAWDGVDYRGAGVASGVYFARMVYGNEVKTLRIVLVR
jgi:hypothetical protein